MADKSEQVTLKAGQEAIIESNDVVTVCLKEGSAEISGAPLKINANEVFSLAGNGARKLSVTTTSGCVVNISHTGLGRLRMDAANVFDVTMAVKKVLQKEAATRILVVGAAGIGKTYAASTVCNVLCQKQGGTVVLLDADVSSNTVCAGCVSSRYVTPDEPSWPGRSTLLMPVSFYLGAGNLTTQNLDLYFHLLEQSSACSAWMAKSKNTPAQHIVMDTPSAPEGVDPLVFQRRLVETLRPTHLFYLSADASTSKAAHDDLVRLNPSMQVVNLKALSSMPFTDAKNPTLVNLSVEEYFCGPANDPLGCAKVVVKGSDLKLHHVVGGGREGTPRASGALSAFSALKKGMVLAVSQAAIIQELPFANVMGLILVAEVDAEHDEVALVVPSGDSKIPRSFFIVPSAEVSHAAPLLYTGDNIDAVCV